MSYNHALMSSACQEEATPERKAKLFEYAKKIMDEIQPAIDETYNQISHWKETGQAPPEGTVEDGIRMQKRVASLRSSISRYRRQLREETDPERRAELEKKIEALSEQLPK